MCEGGVEEGGGGRVTVAVFDEALVGNAPLWSGLAWQNTEKNINLSSESGKG